MAQWTKFIRKVDRLKKGNSLVWNGYGIRRDGENDVAFAKRTRTALTMGSKQRFSVKAVNGGVEVTKVGSWMEYDQQFANHSLLAFKRARLKAKRQEQAKKELEEKRIKEKRPWLKARRTYKQVRKYLRNLSQSPQRESSQETTSQDSCLR